MMLRDPSLMNRLGAAASAMPGGHPKGFADTWQAVFRQVNAAVARGSRSLDATYAGFEDGHSEMLFCDDVLQSARTGRWLEIAAWKDAP